MINVRITGVESVEAGMKKVIARIEEGAREGMMQAAMVIESDSKANAPLDTANLRASHFIYRKGRSTPEPRILPAKGVDAAKLKAAFAQTMSKSQAEVKDENTIRVGAAAFYAVFVEYGNPAKNWNSGAPRFMRTARDRNVANVLHLAARGAASALV